MHTKELTIKKLNSPYNQFRWGIYRTDGKGNALALVITEANAHHLIKCWNSHDALLAACKNTEWVAMDKLAKWRCPACMNSKENGHWQNCKTNQAIAQAKE